MKKASSLEKERAKWVHEFVIGPIICLKMEIGPCYLHTHIVIYTCT